MALDTDNPMTSSKPPKHRQGPGPALRAKREEGGHSLDDVSRDTRITCTKLAAIEAEEYAKAGSDTFVMGYIRQYAKWLGMDADKLVRDYEAAMGREYVIQQELEGARQRRGTSSRKLPLTWLVVGVVAAWVGVALYLNGTRQPEPQPAEAPPAAEVESLDSKILEETASAGPEGAEEDIAVVDDAPTEEPVDAPPPSEVAVPAERQEPEQMAGADAAPTDELPLDEGASEQVSEPEPAATDELFMTFSDECWVEVRGANGDVLFAQLQQAGDNLRLSGQAPFNVMLGNARAATVFFNGQLVNSDPGPNRDTLRLRVGR